MTDGQIEALMATLTFFAAICTVTAIICAFH